MQLAAPFLYLPSSSFILTFLYLPSSSFTSLHPPSGAWATPATSLAPSPPSKTACASSEAPRQASETLCEIVTTKPPKLTPAPPQESSVDGVEIARVSCNLAALYATHWALSDAEHCYLEAVGGGGVGGVWWQWRWCLLVLAGFHPARCVLASLMMRVGVFDDACMRHVLCQVKLRTEALGRQSVETVRVLQCCCVQGKSETFACAGGDVA